MSELTCFNNSFIIFRLLATSITETFIDMTETFIDMTETFIKGKRDINEEINTYKIKFA